MQTTIVRKLFADQLHDAMRQRRAAFRKVERLNKQAKKTGLPVLLKLLNVSRTR